VCVCVCVCVCVRHCVCETKNLIYSFSGGKYDCGSVVLPNFCFREFFLMFHWGTKNEFV